MNSQVKTAQKLRRTSDNKLTGIVRLLLAVLFLMTGAMKLLVPMLAEAWSGQLLAANLLRVTGNLEMRDGVIHVIAGRCEDLSHLLGNLEIHSRNFH